MGLIYPVNVFMTAGIIFLPAVVFDRFQALKKPIVYRTWNHKKRALRAYFIGLSMAILMETRAILRFRTVQVDNEYIVIVNIAWETSRLGYAINAIRGLTRLCSIVLTCVLSLFVVKYFRAAMVKSKQILKTTRQNFVENNAKLIGGKQLTGLLLGQVALFIIGYFPVTVGTYAIFSKGTMEALETRGTVTAIGEMLAQTAMCWNCFVYIGLSAKFRREFVNVIKGVNCCQK